MENERNQVKVSVNGNYFELSGSSEFIDKHLGNLITLLQESNSNAFSNQSNDEAIADNASIPGPEVAPAASPASSKPYSKSLHFEDQDVRVIQKMPGTNKAQKSINTALVYLWGKRHVGVNEIPYSEIRELCKNQGCLDSGNFSKHMQSAKQEIIVSGKSGSSSKTCKLTLPGVEKAKEILDSLQ